MQLFMLGDFISSSSNGDTFESERQGGLTGGDSGSLLDISVHMVIRWLCYLNASLSAIIIFLLHPLRKDK